MAVAGKDTIYIDIDDEITGIIDKMRASDGKVVALVLPKRATVLQSIVNMRLLKRAADEAKKHVVLITSEAGLLPLAGVAGMYVAKSLTSKPEVPSAPDNDDDEEETVEEPEAGEPDDNREVTAATAGSMAVGALAAGAVAKPPSDEVETVELDDDVTPDDDDSAGLSDKAKPKAAKPSKLKKDKKLQVPNFERFRLWLVLGALALILLIVGIILAVSVLPKATIDVKTDATNVNASLTLNLSTSASSLNQDNSTVPATQAQQQKTYNQQAATTGQKNEGDKASGTITVTNCGPSSATLPAGTGFSSGNFTFISQSAILVPASNFNFFHDCKNDGNANVSVTAQSGGSAYNLSSGTKYSIANNPGNLSAQGGTMSGGTDNVVQVVSQADIDGAKSKISTTDASVKQALESQLKGQGLYPITATFSAGTPTVTTSANVGDTASTVTVTEVVTYTMFGVHQSDLKTLIDNNVNNQIDTAKQSILSEGLDTATFSVQNSSNTGAQVGLQTTAIAGPQLDIGNLKQQVVGMKSGDVKSTLEANPDVTDVTVKFSPFWVTTVPKKTNKITINVAKPTTTSKSNASNP